MRYGVLAFALIGAATLGGCNEGVLDPKGPIALAERQIMFNSTRNHAGDRNPNDPRHAWCRLLVSLVQYARHLPARFRLFRPPRAARLVDSDHDRDSGGRRRLGRLIRPRSAQADCLCGQARQRSGRLARLEMAVHLSRPRDCDRQSADHSRGHANQLRTDVFRRHEQLLCAAARRPDLHHGRDGDAPLSAGRPYRNLSVECRQITAARDFPTCSFNVDAVPPEKFAQWVAATRTTTARCSTPQSLCRIWPSRAKRSLLSPIVPWLPICSTTS